jgi:16S rRNA (uracil1498-N3)-methyltransferase
MHRFYAPPENFTDDRVVLDEVESRHFSTVLRLDSGDEVNEFDGKGREFRCVAGSGKNNEELKISGEESPSAPESPCRISLAAALIKKEKFEFVIQKAVELGVTRFVPLQTKRCEVRPDTSEKRFARWNSIALDAAKQCGRAQLMVLDPINRLEDFIKEPAAAEARLFFSERNGGKFDNIDRPERVTIVIGPVGGWDDTELASAINSEYQIITLGGRILRADTAAVSITTIIQHRYGDIIKMSEDLAVLGR